MGDFRPCSAAAFLPFSCRQKQFPTGDMIVSVFRRLLMLVAAITILLMVLPPLFDTFDTWDKGPELPVVGHNTETTIVVMSLQIGLGLAVAWGSILFLKCLGELSAAMRDVLLVPATEARARGMDYQLLLFSPPWRLTFLRI